MKKVSVKNLSRLSLVLIAASAVTALWPDKSNAKRFDDGSLRLNSFSAGPEIDAPNIVPCKVLIGAMSCSATKSETPTGYFADESYVFINGLFIKHMAILQTASIAGNQNSVLVTV